MKQNNKINKEDFITVLANMSPEEINKYIAEKGKPRKLIEPIIYFKSKPKTDD